jgi:hypothetical protein
MINTKTLMSWQFVATVLTAAGLWLTALLGNTIPDKYAYIATGVVAGLYALARGVTKFNGPPKSVLHTTEFYVVVIGAAVATLGAFHGHIGVGVYTAIAGFLTFATTIAHALSSPSQSAS